MAVPTEDRWWEDTETVHSIRDFAVLQGIVKRVSNKPDNLQVTTVPVTLTPSPFPEELFHHAFDIQTHINVLVDAVSQDHQFLSTMLESVTSTDNFTRRLLEIHNKVAHDNRQCLGDALGKSTVCAIRAWAGSYPGGYFGIAPAFIQGLSQGKSHHTSPTEFCLFSESDQTCAFSIQRSDYMLDHKAGALPALKQVEMNTIAASCFGLTQDKLDALHRFVADRFCSARKGFNTPPNNCLDSMTNGIAQAWKEYENSKAYVLVMVEKGEQNIYDTRPIEFHLWNVHRIPTVYCTLGEISEQGYLGPNRELIISDKEVAVVYFRTGYSPEHYPTDKEWDGRLLCEMSRASNCPSVGYQLAGTKKVQQALAVQGTLEQYVPDPNAGKIRETFAGLYSLDKGPEGDRAIEMALRNPSDFVAKPQREGGGNNYYDDDVRILLERIKCTPEREAYILMDRLRPPSRPGFLLQSDELHVHSAELTCELGIQGVYIRKQNNVVMNIVGGYILRSKPTSSLEAGVSAGLGSLDVPTLVPLQQFH